jgi:23S rRNA U2552 (ribose-2'-O)-methylase RlmE/FtsJ
MLLHRQQNNKEEDIMTKKIILQIDCQETCNCMNDVSREQLLHMNDDMHKMITTYKNKITPYYNNKTWDKYKKLSNEFELIFTTPNTKSNVSLYNPVSRSFFKMWEIIFDFQNDLLKSFSLKTTPMKCLFLAEGPGGFLEAVMKYRNNKNDHYYGMTLRPDTKSIPEWKLKKFDMSNITTLYGADNTGNLYNLENTHYLEETLGANSMEFITADGGFDFSSDFNNQEDQSMKLIRCEVYCALHLLKADGAFVLKIFDMFHHQTINLMSILKQCFKTIHIIKPLTSRPANSEKYLLCTGYMLNEGREQITYLRNIIIKKSASPRKKQVFENTDLSLLSKIVLYNIYYTSRQVYYIQKTIDLIDSFDDCISSIRNKKYDELLATNYKKCQKWCQKYEIPYIVKE